MVSMRVLPLLCLCALSTAAFSATAAPDVLLEAVLEPEQVYVQAQARYRLRFYHAVDVRDLALHPPSTRVADLHPLGDVRIYESLREGRRYRVHERSYAVQPFASGVLQLSGAYATGRVPASTSVSGDGRKAVRIDAPPRALTVLPAPIDDAHWLPAQSLTLRESWTTAGGAARQRTIRIEATGTHAAQLPELHVTAPGTVVQALPAQLETHITAGKLIGIREQSFLITPTRPGMISLPAVQLLWWTPDGTPMTAILPASTMPGLAKDVESIAVPTAREVRQPSVFSFITLLWLAATTILGASIIMIFRRTYRLRLLLACHRADARAVCTGLLAWAADTWQAAPPRTLGAFAERLQEARAREALAQLDRCLYGASDQKMNSAALRTIVLRVMRSARRRQYDRPGLPHTSGRQNEINNMGWK